MLWLLWAAFLNLFKSRRRLEAENVVLLHPLNVLGRRVPKRLRVTGADRALLVWLYRRCSQILGTLRIIQPEMLIS